VIVTKNECAWQCTFTKGYEMQYSLTLSNYRQALTFAPKVNWRLSSKPVLALLFRSPDIHEVNTPRIDGRA
jgi:hypothetical protein